MNRCCHCLELIDLAEREVIWHRYAIPFTFEDLSDCAATYLSHEDWKNAIHEYRSNEND